jgi:hypothetical protein
VRNVLPFERPQPASADDQPKRRAIRRRSSVLASILTIVLALLGAFASLLAAAVLVYDGPSLSFGPGGLWIGSGPDVVAGRVALSTFTFAQRFVGALMVILLTVSIMFILFNARALFRLYAEGIVFAPANARRIKLMGAGLIFYSMTPFAASRVSLLVGVTNDLGWFHLHDAMALIFGVLAFVIANVMEFGHEIEQERDGFI